MAWGVARLQLAARQVVRSDEALVARWDEALVARPVAHWDEALVARPVAHWDEALVARPVVQESCWAGARTAASDTSCRRRAAA